MRHEGLYICRQVRDILTKCCLAKLSSRKWRQGIALIAFGYWLCSCASTQTAHDSSLSSRADASLTASDSAPSSAVLLTPTAPQPSVALVTPQPAFATQGTAMDHNPLAAWPHSLPLHTTETGQTNGSSALSIVAYEKVLLDRVSPTALRYQAITALLNTPYLQVDQLDEAILIAIVLDTLHHSDRVRDTARRFILKFAGAKVARAYEAVLADLQVNASSNEENTHHQDWLASIGLDMYCQYGERQLQHMVQPTANTRVQLTLAIASFQKAWALRTLASADQQYLFPKALYGWAHALEDRAWMEPDARGIPNAPYNQEAQVKYQEFLTEARKYKDEPHDYQHRAHLYHAESRQEQPTQRGSMKALAWRVLSLTGSFETGMDEPNNFASLAGNFDGQGISFGTLQWNIGQETLQNLLAEIDRQQNTLVQHTFGSNYETLNTVLDQSKARQLTWAKSIQNSKFVLHEPWRKSFETLGTHYEFQKIQVEHAKHLFQSALEFCERYQVRSERAVALMFDILVQDGGIKKDTEAKIFNDFKALRRTGNAEQDEVARLRIIANRVADTAIAKWKEDVRNRKLTIANGSGKVHGIEYNLEERAITLNDYQTRKPLGTAPATALPVTQAGLQGRL